MERSIEKETGGDANVDIKADGSMDVKTKEGTATIGSNKVPDGWPKEIAVYPGATISYSAAVNPDTGKPGMAIVMMSTDDVTTVAAYYKKEAAAAGWTLGQSMETAGTTILTATKGGMTASFMITGVENQTSIAIGVETGAE